MQQQFEKARCYQLYEEMERQITLCKSISSCILHEIEQCFFYSNDFRARADSYAAACVFEHRDDEILFFKTIRPLFGASLLFYSFCYYAELYKTEATDPGSLCRFVDRELLRLQKFRDANRGFYVYYKVGCIGHDADWFTRVPGTCRSSHDHLVASLLALERYSYYLRFQFDKGLQRFQKLDG